MIRILHVLANMNRGGAESFIMNLYRNIDREKIQFDFLLHSTNESSYIREIKELGGRIFYIPPRNQGVFKNNRALNDFFKKHKEYTIVHQHLSSLSYIEPLKIAKKNKVSMRILHSHSTSEGGSKIHKYIHSFNKLFIKKNVTHFFACSHEAAEWTLSRTQYKSNQYEIIKNGIETDHFLFDPQKRNNIREQYEINNAFLMGNVGNFVPPKNHKFLLEIFKEVLKKKPDSILMLVGDGIMREDIEKTIEEFELREKVILTGVQSNISDLLQAFDVFVMPSIFEGLPVTLVEAQAAGLPCIVSENITALVDITSDIHHLNLILPASEWAEKIIDNNKSSKRTNNYSSIFEHGFDIKSVAKRLESLYLQ